MAVWSSHRGAQAGFKQTGAEVAESKPTLVGMLVGVRQGVRERLKRWKRGASGGQQHSRFWEVVVKCRPTSLHQI